VTTLPSMSPGSQLEIIQRVLVGMQQQIDQIRSSAGTFENATVGQRGITLKDSGAITMLDEAGRLLTRFARGAGEFFNPDVDGKVMVDRGRIYFWDLGGSEGDKSIAGQVMVDQGAGRNYMRLFPPHETGSGLETSFTMRGKTDDQTGMVWVYTDGGYLLDADGSVYLAGSQIDSSSVGSNTVRGASVVLNTTAEEMPIYGLPTTSAGANLHLGTVGGKWSLAYITSSRRYKQDIKDAPINASAALSWKPKVWRDISEVKAIGDNAKTHIGFIAEEVAEVSPEFVLYDAQGRPDSLNYDRMVAGVVSTIQLQEKRAEVERQKTVALQAKVEAQSQEIAALKDANTALGLRLDKVTAALKKLGVTP
jgi:hypothetical protein